jgi:hypothetical protein
MTKYDWPGDEDFDFQTRLGGWMRLRSESWINDGRDMGRLNSQARIPASPEYDRGRGVTA